MSRHRGLMVRRRFPVAKIVGSSPAGVVSLYFCYCSDDGSLIKDSWYGFFDVEVVVGL